MRTIGKIYLVVDDIEENTYLVNHILAKSGAAAICTNRAEDALELLKNSNDIDAVITDLRMPGMSGQEFIIEIRNFEKMACRSPVPIIVLTAESDPEERLLCLSRYGANEYLLKPIRLSDLMQALRRSMSETEKQKIMALVVDDENLAAYYLARVLTDAGHIATICGTITEVFVVFW